MNRFYLCILLTLSFHGINAQIESDSIIENLGVSKISNLSFSMSRFNKPTAFNNKVEERFSLIYYKSDHNNDCYRIDGFSNFEHSLTVIYKLGNSMYYSEKSGHKKQLDDVTKSKLVENFRLHTFEVIKLIANAYKEERLKYIGERHFKGKECYEYKYYSKHIEEVFFYIEKETGLIYGYADPPLWQKIYQDYREVEGILIPFQVVNYKEGQVYEEFQYDDIQFNVAIDNSLFDL